MLPGTHSVKRLDKSGGPRRREFVEVFHGLIVQTGVTRRITSYAGKASPSTPTHHPPLAGRRCATTPSRSQRPIRRSRDRISGASYPGKIECQWRGSLAPAPLPDLARRSGINPGRGSGGPSDQSDGGFFEIALRDGDVPTRSQFDDEGADLLRVGNVTLARVEGHLRW